MNDDSIIAAYIEHDLKYHIALNRYCSEDGIAKVVQDTARLNLYRNAYFRLRTELHGHIEEFK